MNLPLSRWARRPAAWALVLAVAMGVRLSLVLTSPPTAQWPDARELEELGARLAAGTPYGMESKHAPVYPYFIAAVYRVAGRDLRALRLVEAATATVAVGLVGAFGAALFSPAAGLVAAGLAAAHPLLSYLPASQYSENLLVLLSVLAFGSFGLAVRRPEVWRWLVAGTLFGLFVLCKPNVVTFLPGLAVGAWLALAPHPARRARGALWFTAAVVLTLLPWTVRNHATYGHWFLVTLGGGRQFWLGNNPETSGASDLVSTPSGRTADSLDRLPNIVDRERLFYSEGWRFVREHPWAAARLYVVKMGALWALYPRTATRNPYTGPAADWAMGLCSVAVYAGALLGLTRLPPRGAWYLPLALVSFTLVNSVFMMVLRYRASFEIVLLWLAGVGYAGLLERGASKLSPPPAA